MLSCSAVPEPKLCWTQLAVTTSVRLELAVRVGFASLNIRCLHYRHLCLD